MICPRPKLTFCVTQDPNDLSFHAGDIIEIVTETNPDWWTGKIGGRQGLFPSNYVEKLDSSPAYPPPSESRSPSYSSPAPPGSYNSYNNAPVPYQAGPPPPQQVQGYNPYMNGPGAVQQAPPPQQVQVQQEQQPQKESKYSGLKQTVRGVFFFYILPNPPVFRMYLMCCCCCCGLGALLCSWLRLRWEVLGLVQVRCMTLMLSSQFWTIGRAMLMLRRVLVIFTRVCYWEWAHQLNLLI